MLSSVRLLLEGIIDYAGLFPPAALGMSEAFDRYVTHRRGPRSFMMSRFVCPASRLAELAPTVGRLREDRAGLALSVLGRSGTAGDRCAADLTADIYDIAVFRASVGSRMVVDQLELKLPGPPVALAPVVTDAVATLKAALPAAAVFFETPLHGPWRGRLPEAVEAVSGAADSGSVVGLKIRCGGLDPSAVPSPAAVSAAIASCRRRGVPLKATQGLHHPVRHFDSELETTVHGFLNLFMASVLAHAHELDEGTLLAIVSEEDPAAFRFREATVGWNHLEAGADQISAARRVGMTSFGSCSFTEPTEDLSALGLLDNKVPGHPPVTEH